MSIPFSVYPKDYFGELGIVECVRCGLKLCVDEEAIQDEFNNQFYCEQCHKELEEERAEEMEGEENE